ncbi:MAG TPA: isochorismatase family protein [Rhodoplanes sp.]|nr:isochorismatase family protein [Rhodoplanes sp.]
MPSMSSDGSTLLMIDFQAKLMRAIDDAATAIGNAGRLLGAAQMLGVPVLFTEQNVKGLGATVPELSSRANGPVAHKMTFDACRAAGFAEMLADRPEVIVTGCEAHVCVLQTALGLLDAGRRVYVVRDAIGSRRAESKEAAIRRMERHGADIVTTEMVVFEWLETAEHPRFRAAATLIR